MRKYIVILLVVLSIFQLPLNVMAAELEQNSTNTIYLEDGSYLTIKIQTTQTKAAGTNAGTKTYTYIASNGEVSWEAVLHGTFTYTGSSATCTASFCNVTINNSSWYVVSKTVDKSGADALCELTMGRKMLGITVGKQSISMKLTCDKNGKLS